MPMPLLRRSRPFSRRFSFFEDPSGEADDHASQGGFAQDQAKQNKGVNEFPPPKMKESPNGKAVRSVLFENQVNNKGGNNGDHQDLMDHRESFPARRLVEISDETKGDDGGQ